MTTLPVPVRRQAVSRSAESGVSLMRDVALAWRAADRTEFVIETLGGTRRAAAMLGVAPSQPSRWTSGESTPGPEAARKLIELDHVLALAYLHWADADLIAGWLTTPNAFLDGVEPATWIQFNGTAEVVAALQAESSGAFA